MKYQKCPAHLDLFFRITLDYTIRAPWHVRQLETCEASVTSWDTIERKETEETWGKMPWPLTVEYWCWEWLLYIRQGSAVMNDLFSFRAAGSSCRVRSKASDEKEKPYAWAQKESKRITRTKYKRWLERTSDSPDSVSSLPTVRVPAHSRQDEVLRRSLRHPRCLH